MPTDTSLDAARSRIVRIVEEIAALSKAEITSEEFFKKFLEHVVSAADARGGAVWLVGPRGQGGSELQLAAAVQFESSLFQSNESQRTALLKVLSSVITSRRPFILLPESGSFQPQAPGGPPSPQALDTSALAGGEPALGVAPPAEIPASLQDPGASRQQPNLNQTPYGFLHVPLLLKKDQPLGVLQIWLQPYVPSSNYAEFVTFLTSLTGYVEQHVQSRRLGGMVVEIQRLQHLLRFSTDLAGSLDTLEVARLTANYSRDLLGCERSSILLHERGEWTVLAISGQEVVEPKSAMVKDIAAFVGAHCGPDLRTLKKKELLDAAGEPANGTAEHADSSRALPRTDEVDLAYFESSRVASAAICPILDSAQRIVGAVFSESGAEAFFEGTSAVAAGELPAPQRMTKWIATHAGRALVAARDYQTLPLLHTSRFLRAKREMLAGDHRRSFLLKLSLLGAAAVIILGWPAQVKVSGNCAVLPAHKAVIVAEVPARVDAIFVKEGDHVEKGQPIAQLDRSRLETDLQGAQQERLRNLAESDRARAAGDEATAQVAALQAGISAGNEKRYQADLQSTTLRAPLAGTVTTKDLEAHIGEFLQIGAPLAEVDDLTNWNVEIEVNEEDIGAVENGLQDLGSIPVEIILYSQSAHPFYGVVDSAQQISAAAYPREKENVFLVTVRDPAIPADFIRNLRPGLTGKARLEMGRRPLIASISRRIVRWLEIKLMLGSPSHSS